MTRPMADWEKKWWPFVVVGGIVLCFGAFFVAEHRGLINRLMVSSVEKGRGGIVTGIQLLGWLGLGSQVFEPPRKFLVRLIERPLGARLFAVAPWLVGGVVLYVAATRVPVALRCSDGLAGRAVTVRVNGELVPKPCEDGSTAAPEPVTVEASAPGFVYAKGVLGRAPPAATQVDGRWVVALDRQPLWRCSYDGKVVDETDIADLCGQPPSGKAWGRARSWRMNLAPVAEEQPQLHTLEAKVLDARASGVAIRPVAPVGECFGEYGSTNPSRARMRLDHACKADSGALSAVVSICETEAASAKALGELATFHILPTVSNGTGSNWKVTCEDTL